MPNYQPQVNYNVPVVQPVQFHEVQRPDINVQPIDLGGFFKGLAISAAAKEKEDADNRYNEGLNKYAIRLNQIAEGQRQGVYKQSDAERLTRQLDDEYLAGGWKAADLYKVRDHFDGGVRKLEEAHQKKLMEADTDFRLKQVDNFREMYPAYRNKDRDIIEGKLDELSKMEQDFQYYTNMLNAGSTEKEIQYAATKRGDTATDLARANTILQLEEMIADPNFNPSQMTQATYDAMRQNLALNLQNKGMNYADSTAAADRALELLNVRQYVNDIKMDADNNTEFMKKMNDNMTESGRSQLLSLPNMPLLVNIRNTALMDSIVTKAGNPFEKLGEQITQASENPDIFRSGYRTAGAASVNDSEVFSQIYSANVKDRIYPVRKLAQQALVTSKTLADTVRNPFDLSGADLDTNNTNNTKALELLKSPDAEAQRAKAATFNDPMLRSTYEATDANITKLEGNQIAYDLLKSGNNPRNLLNSLQASRMRVDDEGYLRMTEGTDGVLQSLGDLLASNETGNEVNTLNKALEKYTPEQRKALLNLASNGEIKPLAAGEAVWDTTTKSLKERAAEVANKGGQYLMELLSFSGSNEETTPAFSQGELNTAGNLGIGDIPLERDSLTAGEIMKNVMLDEAAQNSASGLDSFLDTGLAYIKDQFFPEAEDMPIDSAQLKKELDAKMPKMIEEYKKSAEKGSKSIERTSAELMDIVKKRMDSEGYTPESLQLRKELSENYNKFQEAMQEFIQIEVLKAKLEDTYREEKELYETGFKKIDEKYDAARLADEMNKIETPLFTGEETTTSSKISNKTTLSNAFVEAKPAVEGYNEFIQQSAAKYNVDPQYLDVIAAIESKRGNDKRTSSAGAKGIMQFMPETWRKEVMPNFKGYTEADINDPQKSIEAAAWYLNKCQKFVQTVKPDADPQESAEIQAACYNWGMGKVRKALNGADGNWEKAKRTMPDETKKYVGYVRQYYNAEDPYSDNAEGAEDARIGRENETLVEELQRVIRDEKVLSGEASWSEVIASLIEQFKERQKEARKNIKELADERRNR